MSLRGFVPMLREAVRRAVAASSLRAVAKEIDVSAPGLQHFLRGGYPLPKTARKLAAWHVQQRAASPLDIHEEVALSLLLSRVPEDQRSIAESEIRQALCRALNR